MHTAQPTDRPSDHSRAAMVGPASLYLDSLKRCLTHSLWGETIASFDPPEAGPRLKCKRTLDVSTATPLAAPRACVLSPASARTGSARSGTRGS